MEAVIRLDEQLFFLLNGWLERPAWALFFYLVALYGILIFLLAAFYLWRAAPNTRAGWHNKKTVVLGGLAVLVSMISEQLLDLLIARPRPAVTFPEAVSLSVLQDAGSFPSLHVAVAFAFVTILYLMRYRKLAAVGFLLAALVGLSRIVTGVHYPSDIVAGVIVGVLSAFLVFRESAWLRQYLPSS